jgi:hypothetical protein
MDRPSQARRSLVERALIKDLADGGGLLRLVHLDQSGDVAWLFDTARREWPLSTSATALFAEFESDPPRYEIVYEEPWVTRLHAHDTNSAIDQRHRRNWEIVEFLTKDESERCLFFKATRRKLIDSAVLTMKTTRPTVVTAIMRYWQRGMTFEALRPDYDKCGGPGKPRNITSGKKAGRPRSISPGTGVSINEYLRRAFHDGAGYYLSSSRPAQKEVIDYIVLRYFSDAAENPTAPTPHSELPTIRQFGHFLHTHYEHNHRFRARHGQKRFDLEARAIPGRGDYETRGPGDKFQIDATVADYYLVSQFDRRRIVGRPVIYFVVDVWSRMIVGMYVGFEGPSWIGAMMALTNMVLPKTEYCKQYGITIEPEEWPSHYLPRALVADKGELMSVDLGRRIISSLRGKIENVAAGRGDLKAFVERRFGIVPAKFKQFVPGYVEPDSKERGAPDHRLKARFTLPEFTKMVILAVLEHNSEPITDVSVPTPMTTEGKTAAPIDLWDWGIVNRSGRLRTAHLDDVSLAVMPRATARVTKKGIRFKRGYYTTELAERAGWFSRARQQGEWNVEISFDPRSLDNVYLWNADASRGFEACRLLAPYAELAGKSLFEFEEKERAEKINLAARAVQQQAKRIKTDILMDQIRKEAEAKTEAERDPNATKAQQVAAIRENQSQERALQRVAEAFELAPPTQVAEPIPTATDGSDDHISYETDTLALLKRLKAETIGDSK